MSIADAAGKTIEQRAQRKNIGPARKKRMEAFLGLRAQGLTVENACSKLGVTVEAYKQWKKDSEWFRREATRITMGLAGKRQYPPCPFSPETRTRYFSAEYDEPINPPHLMIAMEFINSLKGGEFGLILFPPEHAKTSLGEDWLSCAIADDPEIRSAVVSKTQPDASVRLAHVQVRMEDRDFYPEFINDFGPFRPEVKSAVRPWSAIRFSVVRKTPRERDFSCQALGIGSQVQGKRLDRVLVDDICDDTNAHEYPKQARYIRQSLNTRLGNQGIGLMIGTRQDEMDVYRHLMDEGFFDKVLVMPAVWPDGSTLWPARYSIEDYERMERKAGPRIWALTYQQKNVVSTGSKFPLALFEACYNEQRKAQTVIPGDIPVGGLDPSAVGYTAAFALSVNRFTELRTWVDVWNEKGLVGDGGDILPGLRQFIVEFVKTYKLQILCLEKNSTFIIVSNDTKLRAELTKLGCRVIGVESTGTGLKGGGAEIENLSLQQLSTVLANGMHQIPTADGSLQVFQPAINQAMAWRPENKKSVKDMLKALQFAEYAARHVIDVDVESEPYASIEGLPSYLADQQQLIPIP